MIGVAAQHSLQVTKKTNLLAEQLFAIFCIRVVSDNIISYGKNYGSRHITCTVFNVIYQPSLFKNTTPPQDNTPPLVIQKKWKKGHVYCMLHISNCAVSVVVPQSRGGERGGFFLPSARYLYRISCDLLCISPAPLPPLSPYHTLVPCCDTIL